MSQREIVVWVDERWCKALEKHLLDGTVAEKLEEYIDELVNQLPENVYKKISEEIWQEQQKAKEEHEASRRFAVFHVTENGAENHFLLERDCDTLSAARWLRDYLRRENNYPSRFGNQFREAVPITAKQFDAYVAERLYTPSRVTGAFDIDLDKGRFDTLHIIDGWQHFRIQDVSTAAYYAMKKSNTVWGEREHIFLSRLDGKQLTNEDSTIYLAGTRTLRAEDDETGIEVNGRLAETLHEAGYSNVSTLQPRHKDWNEDLKSRHGLEAQAPIEHPQLVVAPEVCRRIGKLSERAKVDTAKQVLPWLMDKYCTHLHWGRFAQAMTCMEQMAALSLAASCRELRQLGDAVKLEDLTDVLRREIQPHQNRGMIKSRDTELRMEIQSVLAKGNAEGIRTEAEKRQLANAWIDLAVSCAKIPVKYEADLLKQQQKQEQAESMEECPEQQTPSAMSMAQQMM